jgi:hypothetical protein
MQTSMFPVGFELTIPATELPQVHASVIRATEMALFSHIRVILHVVTTSVLWTDQHSSTLRFSTTSFRMA